MLLMPRINFGNRVKQLNIKKQNIRYHIELLIYVNKIEL